MQNGEVRLKAGKSLGAVGKVSGAEACSGVETRRVRSLQVREEQDARI